MNIDELELVPVEKANSKVSTNVPKGPKNEPFDLRRSSTKTGERFTLTRKAFEKYGFASNSAKQFNQPSAVIIAVMPGNGGVFLRNTNKGGKGRAFKNDELAKALDERNIIAKTFAFRELGEKDGAKYYVLDPVAKATKQPAAEATATA